MPVEGDGLWHRLRDAFAPCPPSKLAVAVSGGGDSVALLHLLAHWSRNGGPELAAVTIDHGLRAAATDEAAEVARLCQSLGVAHETLQWTGWDGSGNLMDAARRARIRLIAGWAKEQSILHAALGHTSDDQAETFLMRLARGSGVDGLSAMADRREAFGIRWHRPLLGINRQELRDYLLDQGVSWVEDPTNDDLRFDRIKMRQALAVLAPLGITKNRISHTVFLMSMAREVLQGAVLRLAETVTVAEAGAVVVEKRAFSLEPFETQLRFLAEAIRWVSSSDYRPRLDSLMALHSDVIQCRKRTLSGCILQSDASYLRITREPRAVVGVVCLPDQLWDNRWRMEGPSEAALEVRALGAEGLRACKDWRETGISRDALIVSPAIWRGDALVAAPLAGFANGWTARIDAGFTSFIISH